MDFEIGYAVDVDDLVVQAISFDGWHEYRILKGNTVLLTSEQCFGQAGIALRDGLIKATDPLWVF